MIRYYWKRALFAALISSGLIGVSVLAAPPSATPISTKKASTSRESSSKPQDFFTLKEQGKPDRKCVILSSTTRPDGSLVHQVKALDNGEKMTIVEPKSSPAAKTPAAVATATPTPVASATSNPMNPLPLTVDPDPVPSALNPPKKVTVETTSPTRAPQPVPTVTTSMTKPVEQKNHGLIGRLFGPTTPHTTTTPPPVVTSPMPISMVKPTPIPAKPVTTPVINPKPVTNEPISAIVPPMPTNTSGKALVGTLPVEPVTDATLSTPVIRPRVPNMNSPLDMMKEALTDAIQPSSREIAAEGLIATAEGKSDDVRKLLLTSVQNDPAATVRATCLRCLGMQGISDEILQAALITASKDRDPRVQEELKQIVDRINRK